jgi:hypothetical protein
MDIEAGPNSNAGWFSEASVQQILFDIYDSANEPHDTVALGIGPILDVLTGPQKTTPALTSIFSFIHHLKSLNPSAASSIDNLLTDKNISPIIDIYGTDENNDGNNQYTLPIYNVLPINGSSVTVTMAGGSSQRVNSMNNTRFLRYTPTTSKTRLSVSCTGYCIFVIYRSGVELGAYSTSSSGATTLSSIAGQEHVILISTQTSTTNINATMSVQSI